MQENAQVIQQTKEWIVRVVVGCNFCPFAAREIKLNSIHYQVEAATELSICLQAFLPECVRLDGDDTIATTLLIFPNAFPEFDGFLDLVSFAETLLKRNEYEGIYQVASFHPKYRFANAIANDAANYTNRSIYPMLHILREKQIENALLHYANPEQIPQRNINFAREKGEVYMKMLREGLIV